MPVRLLPALICAAALWGCDDTTAPSTPTQPTQLNVTGRLTGDLVVQNVTGRMTWDLTQSGTSVTGPARIGLPSGTVLLNGTLTGTLTGTSLPYTIAVAPNGVPTQPRCTGEFAGTMTVNPGAISTMTGPIALRSSSCTIQFSSANFTLTRLSAIGAAVFQP